MLLNLQINWGRVLGSDFLGIFDVYFNVYSKRNRGFMRLLYFRGRIKQKYKLHDHGFD